MHIRRRTRIQLAVFAAISIAAALAMALGYMRLPHLLFGAGHYEVTVELPSTGGLYPRANVTYRGTEVGQVRDVRLTDDGVEAVLSLRSNVAIPSNLDAEVHSQTAVGEQYMDLSPRNDNSPPLRNGDVIRRDQTSAPPDINSLLDATNRGLQAIPSDNLQTVIDEAYTAFGGLGPEITRIVKGSTAVAIDARKNLADLTNLVDNSAPLLDTQTETSDSVRAWAAHIAAITAELQTHDDDVAGILRDGPAAAEEGRLLLDRFRPTLPVLLANLTSIAPVLVTYQASLEQLLVLLPLAVANTQATVLADRDNPSPYKGFGLNFNMNMNLPSPCNTGYLPPQQMRPASSLDQPERAPGDLYCRIPQDSLLNVRGARNIPCTTRPGKRAPTVKICESDENYVPLNDGYNWKGDPNATLSGQDVPQLPPDSPPRADAVAAPPPIAVAEYDPATGRYIGPDGKVYTQGNLDQSAQSGQTWQSMLVPPTAP
ncbi:MCE family protein [Mycobacterium deserti]|uniref:MCE family protein n=1 Tax=Mycobacterium deserti TaxID=2978347 RepID=A0ABT2MFF0_9MYCO|nr:MlaD family protein [Mycobacterium deserti]MCT7660686.1 MCE family protein [Mycobacterium deserti]